VLRGSGAIAVALGVMSLATYGFTVLAARILGPRPYGALAALMAMLLVIGVLQLGLQATAARRISATPEHVGQIEAAVLTVTYRSAIGLGILLLLLTPALNVLLRLESMPTAAMIGVAAVPMTIMGGQAGILQGERRWWPLAVLYVAAGVPRLVLGVGLMAFWKTEFAAMLGVTIAAWAPVLVGWWALRGHRQPSDLSAEHNLRSVWREIARSSHALFAFFVLSNIDILIARNLLDKHQAGLYAGGLILAKAVLFLPQFVVVVAFPSMSDEASRARALRGSLALVTALGAACVAGAWLLAGWALLFVGGRQFGEIEGDLWLFAALGTVLSLLQLLVYGVLARQGQRSVYGIWGAVLALVAASWVSARSVQELLALVTGLDALLFLGLLGLTAYRLRTAPTTGSPPGPAAPAAPNGQ
jgi:O-antigen/teichoic acid export membrane protein